MTKKLIILLYLFTLVVSAETISIDFNTFIFKGEEAEMQGIDQSFGVGKNWNQIYIPQKNQGELKVDSLKDSEGKPTEVSLHLKGPKITSWWSTTKLMPESKLYRDYVGFPKPAEIVISGLKPNTEYQLAVFGYPLNWGNVQLNLNGQSVKVHSAPEWKEKQQPADIMKVSTDADGRLSGTVEGLLCGLHISTDPLAIRNREVKMLEGEPEKEKPPLYPPTKSVMYKSIDGVDLYMDVYEPKGHKATDKRPAIVFFHGGSWSGGWKTYFSPQCHYFSSRGMVAFTVQYRVRSRHKGATVDQCVMDAKSAMRWIRKHAAELGVDPSKIAAGGGSAGGHLAAATAYLTAYDESGEDTSVSCRPQALVLLNPVIDNSPTGGYPFGPQPIAETWRQWSPMHNIKNGEAVPTIFMLGDKDHLIPVSTGEEYKKITEAAGADCEYYVYPNAKHGFYTGGSNLKNTLYRTDRFLAKHGFLSGEPTIKEK